MRTPTSIQVGTAICKALGLDPSTISRMAIYINPRRDVTIEIKTFATEEMMDGFEQELSSLTQTYHLVKKEE